jgi:mRNA interferase YafQ
LKRPASSKRATLPRSADFTSAFKKDWDRYCRAGCNDMARLKEAIMLLIAADVPLGAEWRDHALVGDYLGFRECHIGGDFLLVYKLDKDRIVFTRIGTHAELFG